MKKINLNNSYNTRDLGGYKTIDDKETKYNVFIRSDVIDNLSEEEVSYFLDNNIKTIIDLRSDVELLKKTSYFENDSRFLYNRVELEGKDAPMNEADIPYNYISILDNKKDIKNILNIILSSQTGILFHCSMGKDRTGVIAMILFLIANVSRKIIIKDYSISDKNIKELIIEYHRKKPNAPKFIGLSKSEYMSKTLDLFFDKYKSIDNYIYYLGFSNNDINKIRERFIV